VAVQTRPYDAQDDDDEQDGEGHGRADEGRGEDRGHGVKGWGGGMGQRGEEGDERSGESRAHEGGEAERPDAGDATPWEQVMEADLRAEASMRERTSAGAKNWNNALRAVPDRAPGQGQEDERPPGRRWGQVVKRARMS